MILYVGEPTNTNKYCVKIRGNQHIGYFKVEGNIPPTPPVATPLHYILYIYIQYMNVS